VSGVRSPVNRAEALQMMLLGARFLAAAGATEMTTGEQGQCISVLERVHGLITAARSLILAAFMAGRGHHADADYSPRSWLVNRTRVTKGAAAGYLGWARRTATHPRVIAALAAGQVPESIARTVCDWTDKLPEGSRDAADAILLVAAGAGATLEDLARLAGEMYARSRSAPDGDGAADGFDDRSVRLETTFDGAGVLGGDLSPECAAVVVILSFGVSWGCDLRHRVVDPVSDVMAAT
jgi:hypothetical protein